MYGRDLNDPLEAMQRKLTILQTDMNALTSQMEALQLSVNRSDNFNRAAYIRISSTLRILLLIVAVCVAYWWFS
ncbi:hypothetical protein ROA7450_03370 [Roseovarius albus]|uniref:Uncharacterized protein n=1 Tax=Roseovarius albus TaxID=1247867 RepID=A0A1X6ZXE4_9RHOB|nr:hypothetical protein ROA7450_03370 [Roseovarius albus]